MTNEYYTATGNPQTETRGISASMRAEFLLIQAAFDEVAVKNGEANNSASPAGNATIILTVASSSYQRIITPYGRGTLVLPDATTMLAGANVFTVDNIGGVAISSNFGDLVIEDSTGTILGFLAPGKSTAIHLSDNTSAAGIWSLPDSSKVGYMTRKGVGLSSSVGGTAGTFMKSIPLDANRSLLLVWGTSLHAVVYNSATNQYGNPSLIRANLSSAGANEIVTAILVGADSTLVLSVPDGGTSLQATVVTTLNNSITSVSTPLPVTTGAAVTRLQDILAVGSAYVLSYLNGTTSFRTIAFTVSGTTPAAGAEITNSTTGPATILMNTASTMIVLTSMATAITAKGYTLAGNTQTAGGTATLTCSATDSMSVRWSSPKWLIVYKNGGPFCAFLSMATTSPAFGAAVRCSSAVNAINSNGITVSPGVGPILGNPNLSYIGTTGTDSSGRFITEFSSAQDTGGTAPVVSATTTVTATAAAQTCAMINLDAYNMVPGSGDCAFQIATSKEIVNIVLVSFGAVFERNEFRTGLLTGFQAPAQDYVNIQRTNRKNLMVNGFDAATLGDGSKRSLLFQYAGYVRETDIPIPVTQDASIYGADGETIASTWVAFSQAPSTTVIFEKVQIA